MPQNNFFLTQQELNQFHKNGYIGPFKLHEPNEMKELWRQIRYQLNDRTYAVYQDDIGFAGNTNISNYDRHLDIDLLSGHIANPKIVDRVSSILGENLLCWRSEFFPKHKGDEGTDWHQADTFANASGSPQIVWPEEMNIKQGQGTITVWTAFTDAKIENACLQFIPGTHKHMFYDEGKGMEYHASLINKIQKGGETRGFFGYDYRQLQIDPDWKPNEVDAVSMEMEAGEFIIFWSTLMHASHPHTSTVQKMRMGYVSRYVPTCVKIYPNTTTGFEYGGEIPLDRYGSVLVSGQDEYHHNTLVDKNLRGTPFRAPKAYATL